MPTALAAKPSEAPPEGEEPRQSEDAAAQKDVEKAAEARGGDDMEGEAASTKDATSVDDDDDDAGEEANDDGNAAEPRAEGSDKGKGKGQAEDGKAEDGKARPLPAPVHDPWKPAMSAEEEGATSSKKRKAGEGDRPQVVHDAKPGDNFVKLKLKLPPPPQRLGLVLQDDKEYKNLPILVKLTPDSPLHAAIPNYLLGGSYWIMMVGRHGLGQAAVTDSHSLQEELTARRKEEGETTVDFTFAKRLDVPKVHDPSAAKKRKTDGGGGSAAVTAVRGEGRKDDDFVALTLTLPARGKLGMIFRDDDANNNLPILKALDPHSPLKDDIPQHLLQNYWLIGVSDEKNGEARITNSANLMKELAARRKEGEEVSVEFTFANRSIATQRQALLLQEPQMQFQMQAARNQHLQQQAGYAQLMAQQAMQGQVWQRQRQFMMQGVTGQHPLMAAVGGALPAPGQQPAGSGGKSPSKKAPPPECDDPKEYKGRGTGRDDTIRKALSEFFAEGETRPLKPFCQEYSKLYKTLTRLVSNTPGLCEIRDRRKPGEGFTRDDHLGAVYQLNRIFSDRYVKMKKGQEKATEDIAREMKRPFLPPLKPNGTCKGLQSEVLERYCANENNDKELLYDKVRLSNFKGWRHRDCPFIGEIDKNQRCTKCNSALRNLKRHPVLTKEPKEPKVEAALLPKSSKIRSAINHRLQALEVDAVPQDPQLALVAQILKIKGKKEIELGELHYGSKNLLMVCEDCGCHVLKRKASNVTSTCSKCGRARDAEKKRQKQSKLSKEDRVSTDSTVTWKCLTSEEQEQRYQNLRTLKNELARKLKSLEERESRVRPKDEVYDQRHHREPAGRKSTGEEGDYRAPLLPWPFYLNYNPVMAEDYAVPVETAPPAAKRARKRTLEAMDGTESASGFHPLTEEEMKMEVEKERQEEAEEAAEEAEEAAEEEQEQEQEEEQEEVDVVEESLDHASVGSLQGGASPSNDDDGGDDGDEEEREVDGEDEFDGHLV